jgi:hypothetical protein
VKVYTVLMLLLIFLFSVNLRREHFEERYHLRESERRKRILNALKRMLQHINVICISNLVKLFHFSRFSFWPRNCRFVVCVAQEMALFKVERKIFKFCNFKFR